MNRPEELLEIFRDAAKRHYAATLQGDYEAANRNADVVEATFKQVLGYGIEGREQLLRLVDDQDLPVALKAATHSISYSPARCEKVIRRIAKERELIGFIAKEALKRWKEGNLNFG